MKSSITTLIFALALLVGSTYMSAWTAPNSTPPSDNVAAPVNTSAATQYKQGILGVDGLGVMENSYFAGNFVRFEMENRFGARSQLNFVPNDDDGDFNQYYNTDGGGDPRFTAFGHAFRERYNTDSGVYAWLTSDSSGSRNTTFDWQPGMYMLPNGTVVIPKLNVQQICGVLGNNCSSVLPVCDRGETLVADNAGQWRCSDEPTISGWLVNNQHTRSQCESLDGTVVTAGGATICQFDQAYCPAGWANYQNWSTTDSRTCQGTREYCGLGTSCSTGSHAWSNAGTESCSYQSSYRSNDDACITTSSNCGAIVTQVGCY